MTPSHTDLKKEFQVERIAFFSDAVFAIAITLLVIEIKVPEFHRPVKAHELAHVLLELIPKFAGFIVSFFVIAMYWVNHHRFFKYINHYSSKLIWNNMLMLFSIALMPFSSAFYSEFWQSNLILPLGFYVFNICLTGLFNTRMWYIISNPANKLSEGLTDKHLVGFYKMRSIVPPAVFMLSFIVGHFNLMLAYWCPILIFVCMLAVNTYYKKKAPHIFKKV